MHYRVRSHTVEVRQDDGEVFDLNAQGEPCVSILDLQQFIRALREQGAFSYQVMWHLLSQSYSDEGHWIASDIAHPLQIGDRVEGGDVPDDYDTGRIVGASAAGVEVAWDSGVTTTQPADLLRPEGTRIIRADPDEELVDWVVVTADLVWTSIVRAESALE